jgi:hypothetical protein
MEVEIGASDWVPARIVIFQVQYSNRPSGRPHLGMWTDCAGHPNLYTRGNLLCVRWHIKSVFNGSHQR